MAHHVLDQALADVAMTGVFYAVSELDAPWGIAMPPLPGTVVFHLVTSGELVLEVDGEVAHLTAGDLVLVPTGAGHTILDAPGSPATPLFDLPRVEVGERYERIRVSGPGERCDLVCGAVGFSGVGVARLLASLPPVLRAGGGEDAEWMRATFELIGAESRRPRPGSDVVTARLADVLVVRAVRAWLDSDDHADGQGGGRGWVAGVRDPQVGRALAAFHAAPAEGWTLASLAAEAGMSRSAFAERFRDTLGEPAMSYVTGWRMDLAARLVREHSLPLARIAARVGYQSEAAFNRAFRRVHGTTPGAYARRDHVGEMLAVATRAATPPPALADASPAAGG